MLQASHADTRSQESAMFIWEGATAEIGRKKSQGITLPVSIHT